jgi:hypothetical protein
MTLASSDCSLPVPCLPSNNTHSARTADFALQATQIMAGHVTMIAVLLCNGHKLLRLQQLGQTQNNAGSMTHTLALLHSRHGGRAALEVPPSALHA